MEIEDLAKLANEDEGGDGNVYCKECGWWKSGCGH